MQLNINKSKIYKRIVQHYVFLSRLDGQQAKSSQYAHNCKHSPNKIPWQCVHQMAA